MPDIAADTLLSKIQSARQPIAAPALFEINPTSPADQAVTGTSPPCSSCPPAFDMLRPVSLPLHIRIINPPVETLRKESHGIRKAQRDELPVFGKSARSESDKFPVAMGIFLPSPNVLN